MNLGENEKPRPVRQVSLMMNEAVPTSVVQTKLISLTTCQIMRLDRLNNILLLYSDRILSVEFTLDSSTYHLSNTYAPHTLLEKRLSMKN